MESMKRFALAVFAQRLLIGLMFWTAFFMAGFSANAMARGTDADTVQLQVTVLPRQVEDEPDFQCFPFFRNVTRYTTLKYIKSIKDYRNNSYHHCYSQGVNYFLHLHDQVEP